MEYTKAHYRAYANFLGEMANTKLCVFDSSVARKSIRKYYEAMVAGCVIVADVPMDSFDEVGDVISRVPTLSRARVMCGARNVDRMPFLPARTGGSHMISTNESAGKQGPSDGKTPASLVKSPSPARAWERKNANDRDVEKVP